jgi:urease accessory protein
MLDTMASSAQMQRVKGRAGARIGASGRLKDLYQQGSAKVLLPKMHGRAPEVVFLNTAGGVTGGDRLSYSLDVEDGAAAVGTTQTAERGYLSARGRGRIEARLTVGAGGRLHWLPQEMILFNGAALDRQVTVEMAGDAECLMLETLVLGRAAMGERLSRLTLRDRREVIRDGVPVMVEAISLDDADLSRSGPAGLNGAVALSTLVLFAPDAADRLAELRAALPEGGAVRAAASAWDGRVVARFAAAQAYPLRRAVARAVEILSRGPLPRVWQI